MSNEYESPKVIVVSIEPDEKIMGHDGNPIDGGGTTSIGIHDGDQKNTPYQGFN